MSQDDSRRFTDREVALILKHASELDEAHGSSADRGLSRRDLEEIAREAGISVDAVGQAIARVAARRTGKPGHLAPLTHRTVHAVDGELDPGTMKELIRIVDERVSTPGSVVEALGAVRWTSQDRFRSTQISIAPQGDETSIHVTEKATGALARVTHLVPGAVGFMISSSILAGIDLSAGLQVAGLVAGVGAGLAAGRLLWNRISRKSAERVERLAAALTREARGAVERRRTESEESDG